jgi:hypothetical protein
MLSSKDIEKYRLVIQEAIGNIGRDDMGVGEVRETSNGMLTVEFRRGSHRDVREIPVEALQTRELANQAALKAIRPLSKEVEQDALRRA